MAYTKRYAGGFVDTPSQTTAIDSTYLNNTETALVALFGVAPTTNGALVWDGTKFTAANLLKNAQIDPSAAIDWTKINSAGQIANADVKGSAAIARSKLDFGSGLVNADLATAAGIVLSKLANLSSVFGTSISAANTDLAAPPSLQPVTQYQVFPTGGGTLRSIGAGFQGQIICLLNETTAVTIKSALAGGTGAMLTLFNNADVVLPNGGGMLLQYDGQFWREISRNLVGANTYRKTTSKAVNTTVAATDLLNGEITIAPNFMGVNGLLRLTAIGDWLQNSGGAVNGPRFQLVFGGTTIFDTNAVANAATGASRGGWRIVVEIFNAGVTNVQNCFFLLNGESGIGWTASARAGFATGLGQFLGGAGASGDNTMSAQGYNTAAIDTTASKALVLNVINGSASASYETRLTSALVEVV